METYVADGFDSFEECLNHEIVEDDGTAAALKAGLDVMYRAAQERIDEHFGRFAEHASSTCFAVPKELLQAQDLAENLPSCSAEEERTLDEQLRDLRKRLAHADAMRSHCDAQSDALEAEMADHASVVEQLRAGRRTPCSPASRAARAASSLPPPPSSPLRGNSNLCWSRRRRCSAGGSRCPRMSG